MIADGIERFNGWPIQQLYLPGGDRIICTYARDGSEPYQTLHDCNHNVFRLNPKGEVVWQVRRDDSIRPPGWWEMLHRMAREQGRDGERMPFMYIDLIYPNGKRISSDEDGDGKNIALWQPGCIIRLSGDDNAYNLDPETGIAVNVNNGPGRPGWPVVLSDPPLHT